MVSGIFLLRQLLMDVIPNSSAVIDYKVEHDFRSLGWRTMLLRLARSSIRTTPFIPCC
jgi:hypothetical protein